MILSPNIVALFIVEASVMILAITVLFFALKIAIKWNFEANTLYQYTIEKNSFLVSLVIFFVAIIKIMLLPYFVFVLDGLAPLLAGAMCAVGVIGANEYGVILLGMKLVSVLVAGFWIVVHKMDINHKTYPYMKLKMYIFFVLFLCIVIEDILYIYYFFGIKFDSVVECCSVVFSVSQSSSMLPFGIDIRELLVIFAISSIILSVSIKWDFGYVALIFSIFYIFVATYSIIYFFSTYVYELPTHQCPFCLFQKEYRYIGYIIFGSLFGSTFISIYYNAVFLFFGERLQQIKRLSLVLLAIFIIIVLFYPISYYIKNGAWL